MVKLTKAKKQEIKKKYGPPRFTKNDKLHNPNERYFAAYTALQYKLIYYAPEQNFYLYSEEGGLWSTVSYEKVLHLIGDAIQHYSAENFDSEIIAYVTKSFCTSVLCFLKGVVENNDAFIKTSEDAEINKHATAKKYFIHCANTMLEFDFKTEKWIERPFSPDYCSRNKIPISYDPHAECPRFIEKLLSKAMTPDDIKILQQYIGQCLLGINLSQTFLLLIGTPGGGKSTLVNVIEGLTGRWNCTELRLEHMSGRFETGSARGKTLLTGKDVDSEFLSGSGARKLKVITGNDMMTIEPKNQNTRHDIRGDFNVIITSNNQLRIKFDGDIEAWRRRMLVIVYENPPPKEKIVNFDKLLLEEEGSGILNFGLNGTKELLNNKGIISVSPEQEARVNIILQSSRPFEVFAKNFIHPEPGCVITTEEVVAMFMKFCSNLSWPLFTERKAQQLFHQWMTSQYGAVIRKNIKCQGGCKRGYVGFQINKKY